MARITVEDCLKKIPNRFEMVLCAAYRARQLNDGHAPRVDAKDKNTVIALREIAQIYYPYLCRRKKEKQDGQIHNTITRSQGDVQRPP